LAGKRGNGEGNIRRRPDGRWEVRLLLPDGTRKSLYAKTRQEVVKLLGQVTREREQGLTVLHDRQTVAEYLTSWIQAKSYRVKYGSSRRYETIVRRHLIPGLGAHVLSKLTAQQVAAFYAQALAGGMSATLANYCHQVLNTALEEALRLGVVYRNVAAMVDPPRRVKHEMAVFDEAQIQQLLAAVVGDRLEALCLLEVATGMRIGEILGLTWDEVHVEGATVSVRMTMQKHPNRDASREEVKTSHSARIIALPELVVDALQAHQRRQAAERVQLGPAWSDLRLVFPDAVGRPIDARYLRTFWWYRLLKRAGLPRIRFHDLRHTAATLLLARGVPIKVVSEILGHSSVSITLNLYGHVLPHMQQQAAGTMNEILRGSTPALGSKLGSNGQNSSTVDPVC
jgi:integrase